MISLDNAVIQLCTYGMQKDVWHVGLPPALWATMVNYVDLLLCRTRGPREAQTPAGLSLDMFLECPQAMASSEANTAGTQDNP